MTYALRGEKNTPMKPQEKINCITRIKKQITVWALRNTTTFTIINTHPLIWLIWLIMGSTIYEKLRLMEKHVGCMQTFSSLSNPPFQSHKLIPNSVTEHTCKICLCPLLPFPVVPTDMTLGQQVGRKETHNSQRSNPPSLFSSCVTENLLWSPFPLWPHPQEITRTSTNLPTKNQPSSPISRHSLWTLQWAG